MNSDNNDLSLLDQTVEMLAFNVFEELRLLTDIIEPERTEKIVKTIGMVFEHLNSTVAEKQELEHALDEKIRIFNEVESAYKEKIKLVHELRKTIDELQEQLTITPTSNRPKEIVTTPRKTIYTTNNSSQTINSQTTNTLNKTTYTQTTPTRQTTYRNATITKETQTVNNCDKVAKETCSTYEGNLKKQNPIRKVTPTQENKTGSAICKKVIVVGDSNARGIAQLLKNKLPANFRVTGTCVPNGTMEEVLDISKETINKIKETDFVVIIAGFNDVSQGNLPNLSKLKALAEKSNVLISEVRLMHKTNRHLNKLIYQLNSNLQRELKNFTIIPVNNIIDRQHAVSNGIHLNMKGKNILSYNIGKMILSPREENNLNFFNRGRENQTL